MDELTPPEDLRTDFYCHGVIDSQYIVDKTIQELKGEKTGEITRSGLEKNSQKLEKDFGELDCISRAEVLRLMQDNWHTHDGDWAMQESMDDIRALPSVTQQEPKPMVEIDLYSVIKQKYIERKVLDKIKEQIKSNLRGVEIALEVLVKNAPLRPKMEGAKETLEDCLELIDKAESEVEDGECK